MGWNLLVEVQKLEAFAGNLEGQCLLADVAGRVVTAQQMGSKITVDKILLNVNGEARDRKKHQVGKMDDTVTQNIAELGKEDCS